jgi:outer membrane protein
MGVIGLRRGLGVTVGVVLMVLSGGAAARARTLTLEEAVQTALQNNPQVAAADQDAAVTRTRYKEVRSNERPALNFEYSNIRLNEAPTLDVDLGTYFKPAFSHIMDSVPSYMQVPVTGSPGTYVTIANPYKAPTNAALQAADFSLSYPLAEEITEKYTLSLQWPVWTGGRVKYGVSQVRHGAAALDLKAESKRREIAFSVAQAYLGCVLARRVAAVFDEAYETVSGHVKQAESLFAQGIIPKYDLMRAQTELANADRRRLDAHNQADLALAYLMDLLGTPKAEAPDLTTGLSGEEEFSQDYDSVVNTALGQSSDMAALMERDKMYEAGIKGARAGLKPVVALVGQSELRDADLSILTPESYWGVVVKVPLFNGQKSKAEASQQRALRLRNSSDVKRLENGIMLEVKKYYLDLMSARKGLESAGQAVELATESRRLALRRYEVGEGTSMEVTDSVLALSLAETNLENARYQYDIAYYGLMKCTGRIVDEFMHPGGVSQ